jgi:hypothetical protein
MSVFTLPSALGEESSEIREDLGPMAVTARKPRVCGYQRDCERLTERDIRRVVRCEVISQRPDAFEKRRSRIADELEVSEVNEGCFGSRPRNFTARKKLPQARNDFEIDQVRRCNLRL